MYLSGTAAIKAQRKADFCDGTACSRIYHIFTCITAESHIHILPAPECSLLPGLRPFGLHAPGAGRPDHLLHDAHSFRPNDFCSVLGSIRYTDGTLPAGLLRLLGALLPERESFCGAIQALAGHPRSYGRLPGPLFPAAWRVAPVLVVHCSGLSVRRWSFSQQLERLRTGPFIADLQSTSHFQSTLTLRIMLCAYTP